MKYQIRHDYSHWGGDNGRCWKRRRAIKYNNIFFDVFGGKPGSAFKDSIDQFQEFILLYFLFFGSVGQPRLGDKIVGCISKK